MAKDSGQDNSVITKEVWIAFGIGILVYIFWWWTHTFFVVIYFHIWAGLLKIVSLFTPAYDLYIEYLLNVNYSEVTFEQFWDVSGVIGSLTRYFWIPFLVFCSGFILLRNPRGQYSKKLTTADLVEASRSQWPFAALFFDNELKQETKFGPNHRSPLKPREFCEEHSLLNDDGSLKREEANRVFANQLGPLRKDVKGMPVYKRAIVALCILKFSRKGAEYTTLRNVLANLYRKERSVDGARTLINKAFDGMEQETKNLFSKLDSRHAYERTWFYSLFEGTKRGIFPTIEFSFLKGIDRELYLTLNSVGRNRAWVEVAGVKAQWIAEKTYKSGIITPVMEEAVIGLIETLAEVVDRRVED